ncbi:MAG: RNA methyltransferase [Nevskiaceae bacterium]|nr:MAG: RNA methyltransferase [Nevskiaceae bacterium]
MTELPPLASAPDATDPLSAIRIVLVSTSHPGNIGSTARAMLNMGLTDLVLVRPDKYPHSQATAMASGAVSVLERARVVETLEEAVSDCGWVVGTSARPRHLGDEPLRPWDAAAQLAARARYAPVALVFGCERTGLTNDELQRCNAVTMIPANPGYSSLNLSQAVQVMTYELRKAALPEVPPVSSKHEHPWYAPPSAEEMERFYAHLEQALRGTGFLDPANPRVLMRRLRTLFNRAQPDRNELNILRGILTSIETPKIRRPYRPESATRSDGQEDV